MTIDEAKKSAEELERLKEDLREYNEALDYVDSFSFEVFGTDNY